MRGSCGCSLICPTLAVPPRHMNSVDMEYRLAWCLRKAQHGLEWDGIRDQGMPWEERRAQHIADGSMPWPIPLSQTDRTESPARPTIRASTEKKPSLDDNFEVGASRREIALPKPPSSMHSRSHRGARAYINH
ncbi:uncharacterized protein LY79DRAFT_661147 [Colletotrichum navitas]|uniref:Uncharacterized protein n=1 Tax=Colletotrichum navitas TaxID=681940 RepID=A0AAD8V3A8_9PEZI|nr:uncharacterized protein LY79DRAFT_661147 [Colletotrichum navitas]KAK1580538.1 hypothetical protein LY79DRAFT_661147 [Colletotrichum navitas]